MTTPQDRSGSKPDSDASEYAEPEEIEDLEASASDQTNAVGGTSIKFGGTGTMKLDGSRD